jgi:ribonuclease Z
MTRVHRAFIVMALMAAAAGGTFMSRGTIGLAIMRRTAARTILNDTVATLPDGLHVGLCGTGSPFPSTTRSGPCTAVIAGERLFIVDAGRGAASVIVRMGLQTARITAVLMTHYHADHVDGLGQLAETRWLAGSAQTPLGVFGRVGVQQVVDGFNEAYALNRSYRIAVDGTALATPSGFGLAARSFEIPAGQGSVVVLEEDGLRVIAFEVDHAIGGPAVGYRFDYKGRSVAISGDTAKSKNLVRVAHGVDLLVHEAMSPRLVDVLREGATAAGRAGPAQLLQNLQALHATPGDAADVATGAGVGSLVLTHLIPPVPGGILEGPFLDAARLRFNGPLSIGEDGDLISLPAGGRTTRKKNVL